jgi:quinone-modifying oxidoreductase subunit QmoC
MSARGLPWKGRRRVRYQAQLDPHFPSEVAAAVGGDTLRECIQCGRCSATCPMSAYMDYTPRRLIAMTRAGFREDVLRSFTIWVCTSCYSCTVECPKEIPITEVMHALKRISVRENRYPRRFTTPVMVREFVNSIERRGRSTESWISMRLYLKTDPMQLVKYAPLGRRLVRRGRLSIRRERVRRPGELRKMLQEVERLSDAESPPISSSAAVRASVPPLEEVPT